MTSRPKAAELLHLDQQLCFALYATSLAMTKLYKPLLAPLGLTYPQYLVMLVLWERDDRAVHELGELLQLDSGTLTPLLKRLEASGLVSRQRDLADERRVRIRLSPAGAELRQQAESVPQAVLCGMGDQLDGIADLRERLHAVRKRLQTTAKP
ncbi:MAG: MarR family transcriptional regulator [Burkholderiales bacterium]|nr:MarR family transcriptional regulator [Burkholderiales bacterium]MBH2016432.1 MarR family transcriptional regulator [Burkholderiales bacterium]